jgi:hypothetical protein
MKKMKKKFQLKKEKIQIILVIMKMEYQKEKVVID